MGQARSLWSAKAVLAVVAALPWRSLAFVHPTGARETFVVVAPTTGAATAAATSRGCRDFGDRRRNCPPRSALWMSANDITPANGLTTTSGTVQRGGRGGSPCPESDLFDALLASRGRMSGLANPPAGSPHFGDIMGGAEGKGVVLLHHFEPLERVLLTANGNLQRVISSYYDSPVTVEITHSKEVEPAVYDREVTLSVLGRKFCVAKSLVMLHSPECVEAVNRGDVGIGQLFRALDVLPSFELLNAGRSVWAPSRAGRERARAGHLSKEDGEGKEEEGGGGRGGVVSGGMWRVYDLRSQHLSCRIHEEFPPDLFCLDSPAS